MQITQEAVQRLGRDQIEAMEVTQPAPGQELTCIRMRRTYEAALSDILVDSAALAALISKSNAEAMASTSAAVALGSNDSAMAAAVLMRSYTAMAASLSSSRPFRVSRSRRGSIGSTVVFVFMGVPSVMGVVEDNHRKPGGNTHPCKDFGNLVAVAQ